MLLDSISVRIYNFIMVVKVEMDKSLITFTIKGVLEGVLEKSILSSAFAER